MKKLYSILIITLAVAVTTVSCSKDALETSPTTAVSGTACSQMQQLPWCP